MREFDYKVYINDKECDGIMTVEAEDADDAYGKAVEIVGAKLYNALPELDIEYMIEVIGADTNDTY